MWSIEAHRALGWHPQRVRGSRLHRKGLTLGLHAILGDWVSIGIVGAVDPMDAVSTIGVCVVVDWADSDAEIGQRVCEGGLGGGTSFDAPSSRLVSVGTGGADAGALATDGIGILAPIAELNAISGDVAAEEIGH